MVLDRLGLDPATCVAVDDGPQYIAAFNDGRRVRHRARPLGQLPRRPSDGARPRGGRRPRSSSGRPARDAPARAAATPARWPSASPSSQPSLPTVVMIDPGGGVGLGAAVRRRLLHRALADVATAHNPLVGAWSMGSREVGVWINNLGPLQLDLLAPFTKLDPYWGTAARCRRRPTSPRSSGCGW